MLKAIDRQAQETETFLDDLSQYNVDIAEYVLAVMPPQTPVTALADAMVLKSEERARPILR